MIFFLQIIFWPHLFGQHWVAAMDSTEGGSEQRSVGNLACEVGCNLAEKYRTGVKREDRRGEDECLAFEPGQFKGKDRVT